MKEDNIICKIINDKWGDDLIKKWMQYKQQHFNPKKPCKIKLSASEMQ